MIDAINRKSLSVSPGGTAGPYLVVQVLQLDEIRRLLDQHGVRYWVGADFFSMNGGPAEAMINLGRGADVAAIQAVLDSVR